MTSDYQKHCSSVSFSRPKTLTFRTIGMDDSLQQLTPKYPLVNLGCGGAKDEEAFSKVAIDMLNAPKVIGVDPYNIETKRITDKRSTFRDDGLSYLQWCKPNSMNILTNAIDDYILLGLTNISTKRFLISGRNDAVSSEQLAKYEKAEKYIDLLVAAIFKITPTDGAYISLSSYPLEDRASKLFPFKTESGCTLLFSKKPIK
jgi:hypothetical protein